MRDESCSHNGEMKSESFTNSQMCVSEKYVENLLFFYKKSEFEGRKFHGIKFSGKIPSNYVYM